MKSESKSEKNIQKLENIIKEWKKLEYINADNFFEVRLKNDNEEEKNKILLKRVGIV